LVVGIKRVSLTLSLSADNPLYGTKILNLKTQEIGLLICLWENKYADKTVDCLGFLAWLSAFNEFAFVLPSQNKRHSQPTIRSTLAEFCYFLILKIL